MSTVRLELARSDRRMRGCLTVSVVVHALLALLLSRLPQSQPPLEGIVEVTWLEALAPEPAPLPEAMGTPDVPEKPEPVNPARQKSKVQFTRDENEGIAPRPQDDTATRDRLRDRLASLQRDAVTHAPKVASLAGSPLAVPVLAGVAGGTSPARPAAMTRAGSPSAPPVQLTRANPVPGPSAPALQKIREASGSKEESRPMAASSSSREVLAGMRLSGPVADRPLLSYKSPEYPEWAQREMVEGSVRLYFRVLPDGRVKENILIEKTSGFEDFDRNAMEALAQWRFQPLSGGSVGEQWGSIVLDYKLSDAQ